MSVNAINAALLKTSSDIAAVESDVSTAQSDISTLQSAAGPGLVLISRTTISSSVTSVTVSNVFSADYDNYRVALRGESNFSDQISMTFPGASGKVYYHNIILGSFSSSFIGTYYSNQYDLLIGGIDEFAYFIDISYPNLSQPTILAWSGVSNLNTHHGGGYVDSTASHSGFTLSTSQASLVSGAIDVYGYAKS